MNIDLIGNLELTASDLIGQSVAVLGIKGSGKSNTAAVLMEELLEAGVPICVVDIAGEYHTLGDDYKVFVIGKSIETAVAVEVNYHNVCEVARRAYESGTSIVFDVSGYEQEERERLLQLYFQAIWTLSAVKRIPLIVFLEEAHNWIPQRGKTETKKVFVDIASEGRKRGLSLVMVGQRSARIDKDTLSQADIAFLHKVRHPIDMKVYVDLIPRQRGWIRDRVNKLKRGEALVLLGEAVLWAQIRLRRTRHVGFTPSLEDVPVEQLSLFGLLGTEGT